MGVKNSPRLMRDMIMRKRKWRQSAIGSDASRRSCSHPVRVLPSFIATGCPKIAHHLPIFYFQEIYHSHYIDSMSFLTTIIVINNIQIYTNCTIMQLEIREICKNLQDWYGAASPALYLGIWFIFNHNIWFERSKVLNNYLSKLKQNW